MCCLKAPVLCIIQKEWNDIKELGMSIKVLVILVKLEETKMQVSCL